MSRNNAALFLVGMSVTPYYTASYMDDPQGNRIYMGEICTVVKVTRSTIHVRDPRGVIHVRYKSFFRPCPDGQRPLQPFHRSEKELPEGFDMGEGTRVSWGADLIVLYKVPNCTYTGKRASWIDIRAMGLLSPDDASRFLQALKRAHEEQLAFKHGVEPREGE